MFDLFPRKYKIRSILTFRECQLLFCCDEDIIIFDCFLRRIRDEALACIQELQCCDQHPCLRRAKKPQKYNLSLIKTNNIQNDVDDPDYVCPHYKVLRRP